MTKIMLKYVNKSEGASIIKSNLVIIKNIGYRE